LLACPKVHTHALATVGALLAAPRFAQTLTIPRIRTGEACHALRRRAFPDHDVNGTFYYRYSKTQAKIIGA
jgi:hypothetical protein